MSRPPRSAGRAVGIALVAAAATSWGAQSVVAKLLLTRGLDPAGLVSVRTALTAALLALALALRRPQLLRAVPRDLVRLAVLGIVGMALSQYAYYLALVRIPVATALLVTYTAPLVVLAAEVVVLGQPFRRADAVAAGLTLLGAALVVRAYEPAALRVNALGLAAAGACALAFAFYSLWAKALPPRLSPWTVLAYSFGAAALLWLPLAPPWEVLDRPLPAATWAGLAVVVVFGTLVPFALYLAGLRRVSAAQASVTSTLEPVVAGAVAFAVLGERLARPQVAGGLLVLAGIGLLHLRR